MRVWLDDVRPMPEGFDCHVKTARQAILLLARQDVDYISFDHDLGAEEHGTGADVARWIYEQALTCAIKPPEYAVHSMNPVGAERIRDMMHYAYATWDVHEGMRKFLDGIYGDLEQAEA